MVIIPKGQTMPPMPLPSNPPQLSPQGKPHANGPMPVAYPPVAFRGSNPAQLASNASQDSCWHKFWNGRLCMAALGCLTAGLLLFKRTFSKKPPTPPTSPRSLPSPQTRQQKDGFPPAPQEVVIDMGRLPASPTGSNPVSHNPFPNAKEEHIAQEESKLQASSLQASPLMEAELTPLPASPTGQAIALHHDSALEAATDPDSPIVVSPKPGAIVQQSLPADDSDPDEWTVIDGPKAANDGKLKQE